MSYVNVKLEDCATNWSTSNNKKVNVTKNNMLWAMIYANKMHREFKDIKDLQEYVQWRKSQMDFIFDFSRYNLRINDYILKLEKSYLSTLGFDIGMVLANIICKDILGLNHLYHLNAGKYKYNLGSNVDYISQNDRGYFAIEAKGTINDYWYGRSKALDQLSKVARINSKTPYKFAVLTRCRDLVIECRLIDPRNDNIDNIQISDSFWTYQNDIYQMIEKEADIHYGGKMKYITTGDAFFGLISPKNRGLIYDMSNNETYTMELDNKVYTVEYFKDGSIIGIEQ